MDAPKDCPVCRLLNPPDAARCDCGYDFAARRHVGSLLPDTPPITRDTGTVFLLGVALVTVGALVGAGVGVPLRICQVGPTMTGECGLWILGVMVEGLTAGAIFGGLAGAAATPAVVWLLARRTPSPRV
ncbi:MAG: hypothetical protein U0804_11130 [Gemmataceae bacterium]